MKEAVLQKTASRDNKNRWDGRDLVLPFSISGNRYRYLMDDLFQELAPQFLLADVFFLDNEPVGKYRDD